MGYTSSRPTTSLSAQVGRKHVNAVMGRGVAHIAELPRAAAPPRSLFPLFTVSSPAVQTVCRCALWLRNAQGFLTLNEDNAVTWKRSTGEKVFSTSNLRHHEAAGPQRLAGDSLRLLRPARGMKLSFFCWILVVWSATTGRFVLEGQFFTSLPAPVAQVAGVHFTSWPVVGALRSHSQGISISYE